MDDKIVLKITKDDLVKSIAKQSGKTQKNVREVINFLEDEIFTILSSANETQNVQIRLFEGINFESEFTPEKQRFNNLNKKVELVGSRIKPKVNISRTYNEKFFSNK